MARLSAYQVDAWIIKNIVRNLHIECSSNTQVVIKQGSAVGSDDGVIVMEVTGSDLTLDITTSGVNGLDTGSEAANTWYYIYLIWNPTTEVVRGLLSASSSSPTLPSGYTKKRLVGAVRNDGSSNFFRFIQNGLIVLHQDAYRFRAGSMSANTWESYNMSAVIPTSICGQFMLNGRCTRDSSGSADSILYTSYLTKSGTPTPATDGIRRVRVDYTGSDNNETTEWIQGILNGRFSAHLYAGAAYEVELTATGFVLDL